ncbi:response regulator [Pseudanabaena sp. FACHB-1998]|uniref:hybrid sensor histidine kinase/response regulator n=1 Tax=Pseudanabaena sp. FACHB-1998 TaxID=2692858 RepID=UPI00167FE814|nr:hybrid sensor histidine kinase/response regulator [Pseudanabaena sp. FACHB-1998]MBD2176919.1 response regulator [Pseudanabaena sp. FACHB-1998]
MNSEQQQQRIMGYFIEEAREHLQTIEQGVLNLQDILNDSESINELFRAAHSIKGGSAMLGVSSIQHVSHRLEDFFKIIKENPHINVDERLKSLLLAGFDPLSELLDELQVGFKISDELTLETSNRVKPIFAELQSYLNQLTNSDSDRQVAPVVTEQVIPAEIQLQPVGSNSAESVFQKEVTTKMRDMLQLFRGEDSSDTRAGLQAICGYFQEVGDTFALSNWTNLVTQIKNAIAQPTNAYRTLAPILIRELKEAQDLVLANREQEITVSPQIQNLLPSWFSEPEDDEVSTIFTTAAGNIDDDSILEDLAIAATTPITESTITSADLEEIDLFADPSSEDVFDLSDSQDNQIDQLDWIDGEYEISENQHIDGPKIGASELKSLAVLFENDDIDFDAAWEDIESNETNMINQGLDQAPDNHDDFADLLGQEYDDKANVASSKSTPEESNIDQLFGDFPTDEAIDFDDQASEDALFPDDLDNAWVESPLAVKESVNSGLDDLLSNDDAINDEIDLGIDIIDQINEIEESAGVINIEDINFDDINLSEVDLLEYSVPTATKLDEEEGLDNRFINSQDSFVDDLSSEDYFAALDNAGNSQDSEISDYVDHGDDTPNEPFALTLSEEDMALLEDPFAIDDSLDEELMGASTEVVSEEIEGAIADDIDLLLEGAGSEAIDEVSNSLEDITDNSKNDDTSSLNIFDELGFDSDDFDTTSGSRTLEVANAAEFAITPEETNSDYVISDNSELQSESDWEQNLQFLEIETPAESFSDFDNPQPIDNIEEFGDFFSDSENNNDLSNIEVTLSSSSFNEIEVASDELSDFFTEDDAEPQITISNSIATEFEQPITSTDDLADMFADADNSVDNIDAFNTVEGLENVAIDEFSGEFSDVDDLGDFFGESSEAEETNAEITSTEALGDFFSESENIPTNTESLGDFFEDTEESKTVEETDDFGDFDITTESDNELEIFSEEENDVVSSGNAIDELDDFFADNQGMDGSEENDLAIADLAAVSMAIENTDDLGDFFADAEEELSEGFVFSNNVSTEIKDSEELDDFFSEMEASQDDLTEASVEVNAFSDEFTDEFNGNEDLGDFFASSDKSTISVENDFSDFEEELSAESNSVAQLTQFDTSLEENYLEESSPDLFGESDQAAADLATLFSSAEEDDLTVLENELGFNEVRSLTQEEWQDESPENANDFLSEDFFGENDDISDPEFNTDFNDDLTSIQDRFNDLDTELRQTNLSNDEVTASNTIDNLADFFQGDDDDAMSLLDDEAANENSLAVDAIADFAELVNSSNADLDFIDESFAQQPEEIPTSSVISGGFPSQSGIEELNGIDDNFNFDDLEAMIGNSGNSGNEFASSTNEMGLTSESQSTASFSYDQQAANDDMNFDELEALLGDTGSFDSPVVNEPVAKSIEVAPPKPVDDFDELESMLQSAFAKDVGPIKTKTPARPPATARKQRMADTTMRVDVKYLDSLNNLVGELVVNRNLLEQDQERLQQFITSLLHQVQLLSDVSQRMRDQYDRSLLEASLTAGRGGRSFNSSFEASFAIEGSSSNSAVSSEFEGIEFDRYNTFHVLSQEIIELIVRVRESASDIEFVVGETDQVTRQLGTITTQIQDDLKQSRMVPFAQIADRLPRGIRDRALKTGKQAELEIFGRETLIDKAILESLTDPLTHLVNNAIDHGLEDPTTRQAAGKPASGKLTVRAYHQGNQTVISISDDGAGISIDKVKKSAVAKKVRTLSEVDRLNDTEVYGLLFEPGFSTAAQADEFKGRGVGLDVVKTCLDDIRGVIIVESVVGKGTTFTIRLPLTLSISKAMFCISDRARIAFPVDGFEDMVEVPQSQIVLNDKGQPCLPWRDTILPFQHLSNLLAYSRHLSRSNIYGKQDNDELCIIILRNDTSYLALQVDQFLGEYEIVIKQLEGPIPQPAGIAGATVLGDGRVMAIANVLELFDIASGRLRPSASGVITSPPVEEDIAVDPTVLIVDDSITVRELLSLTFAKVGYRVEQAKDGQDAWEKLRAGLPCDMIFCDIEMPRMDGLDLLSRLQKDSRLKEIPVAMLTSRGADRHRQSAIQLGAKGYFTKPYLEEELLSASKRLLAGETLPI